MNNNFVNLNSFANILENELKLNAPVKTGTLKNSIQAFNEMKGLGVNMVDYAIYVNAKDNFINDAFVNTDDELNKLIDDELNKFIDEQLKNIN
jgi:hypothetical protein